MFICNDVSKQKNGRRIGGTLIFWSKDTYKENFLIHHNLLKKEDMAV